MNTVPRHLRMGSIRGRLVRHFLALRNSILVNLRGDGGSDLALVRDTREQVPLLMDDASALQLLACARAVRPLGGAMAEAGVFMGGSARLICAAKGDRPLHLFDVFETLQGAAGPNGGNGAEVRAHFGPTHGRLDDVRQLLAPYPAVRFHVGLFPDFAPDADDLDFSFVHVDLDLPESTRRALEYFRPRLVPGGIMVGDDYADPGVRSAFDSYFEDKPDTRIEQPWGQVVIIKTAV